MKCWKMVGIWVGRPLPSLADSMRRCVSMCVTVCPWCYQSTFLQTPQHAQCDSGFRCVARERWWLLVTMVTQLFDFSAFFVRKWKYVMPLINISLKSCNKKYGTKSVHCNKNSAISEVLFLEDSRKLRFPWVQFYCHKPLKFLIWNPMRGF